MLSAQSTAPLIERVPVTKIKPAAYNPRKDLGPHDPEYQRIVRSISEFGLVEPLVWNRRTGNLVGGHQRFKVLVARGVKRVNVSVVDLPLAKEKALNLALNRVSGEWDDAKLAEILDELVSVPEFEIDVTGFDLPDVQEILASAVGPDSDGEEDGFDLQEDLETHGEPITRQGDLIRLGPHRVLCGDATDPAQVRRLLRGKPIDLLFTDPPYNVSYTGDRPSRSRPRKTGARRRARPRRPLIRHDSMSEADYAAWLGKALAAAVEPLNPGGCFYIWNGFRNFHLMESLLRDADCRTAAVITWAKERFALGYGDYNPQTEFCLYGWKPGEPKSGEKRRWFGPASESTLWEVTRDPAVHYQHPTQKPVALAARALRNSTLPDDRVFDPFLGSGSTLVAAALQRRRCLGIEIEPKHCDAIVRRYIALTGRDAVSDRIAAKYAPRRPERS